jgi:hypothetical protein
VVGGVFLATASAAPAIAAWLLYEAAYLAVAPRIRWLTGSSGEEGEPEAELASLSQEDRKRYAELERLRAEIASDLPPGAMSAEILGGLDRMRSLFRTFLEKRAGYLALLRSLASDLGVTPSDSFGRPLPPRGRERVLAAANLEALEGWLRDAYDRRLTEIEAQGAGERDAEGQVLVERRREATRQLRDSAAAIVQATRNVERQLDLVYDNFRLIHTQFRSQSPDLLVPQVEEVVRSSRALSEALAEVAPLEAQIQRLGTLQ